MLRARQGTKEFQIKAHVCVQPIKAVFPLQIFSPKDTIYAMILFSVLCTVLFCISYIHFDFYFIFSIFIVFPWHWRLGLGFACPLPVREIRTIQCTMYYIYNIHEIHGRRHTPEQCRPFKTETSDRFEHSGRTYIIISVRRHTGTSPSQ